ncbi:MAG: M24 family metallopeptidase, partial [Fimbriimonadales bacterium]
IHLGPAPAETRAAYKALCEAMTEALGSIRPGATRACDVYPLVESALDRRGFGDDLRRRLGDSQTIGHSIGTEVHERPWLGPASPDPLVPGMVLAIEPKLWRPGRYYLRLEEIVHVREDGAEFLTRFPHDLFEI